MLLTRRTVALGGLATLVASGNPVHGQVSFKDKTVNMIIGSPPGGGSDAAGRVIARFLGKYLPGQPEVVIQNMPGANGITSLNHFIHRTQPDGLTVLVCTTSPLDPVAFRTSNARYDPKALAIVGGVGRGGTIIFITKAAEPKLYDKSASPAVIGSIDAAPRTAMQPAIWGIEYLGWNAKWVVGYRGTQEVMLAFDRGEIDMTSTGNLFQIEDRLKSGTLKIVNQSGTIEDGKLVGRADYGNAPLFPEQMKGKITDPTAQKAFDYWLAQNNLDKVIALAPNTPRNIVEIYRTALGKVFEDPEFHKFGEKISEGFTPTPVTDVENAVRSLADTTPEALEYIKGLMQKQGLRIR